VAGAIITIPTGLLANKLGIRKILLFALLMLATGSAFFGLATTWEVTAVALSVLTLAIGMAMIVCPMICGRTLKSEERVTGMQLCDTVSAIPRLIAPIIAAFLITSFGGMKVESIRPMFWIQTIGILIAFFVIFKFFNDPLSKQSLKTGGNLSQLSEFVKKGRMCKRWVAYLMISSFPLYMAFYIPLYAAKLKGANQFILGWMDAASWLIITILALPIGRLADIYGKKKLIVVMWSLYSIAMLLMVYASNHIALIIAGLLNGFWMLAAVTQGAITVELVPQEFLGSWLGIIGFFRGIANIISPILGGFIWKTIGPEYVFYFLAFTQLVKLIILVSMPKRL